LDDACGANRVAAFGQESLSEHHSRDCSIAEMNPALNEWLTLVGYTFICFTWLQNQTSFMFSTCSISRTHHQAVQHEPGSGKRSKENLKGINLIREDENLTYEYHAPCKRIDAL
jgi:hypothetical protein